MWRGDNNGQGDKSDCDGQCAPGETNIKGIRSSWGGGFVNDRDTNRCGRGYKTFCCPNPDFPTVTKGCKYADCRSNCPSGTTSVLSKSDDCFIGSQQYCCPNPVQLTSCHWTSGESGRDCANAVCSPTELEVDRATFGDAFGSCFCKSPMNDSSGTQLMVDTSVDRKRAACCTVSKAPAKPATCSADLCNEIPGLCPPDNDNEGGTSPNEKRSVETFENTTSSHLHVFEKRDSGKTYYPSIRALLLIAAAYPPIGELFNQANSRLVLRRLWRLVRGYCSSRSIDEQDIPEGTHPEGLQGLQSEHPLDVSNHQRILSIAC